VERLVRLFLWLFLPPVVLVFTSSFTAVNAFAFNPFLLSLFFVLPLFVFHLFLPFRGFQVLFGSLFHHTYPVPLGMSPQTPFSRMANTKFTGSRIFRRSGGTPCYEFI